MDFAIQLNAGQRTAVNAIRSGKNVFLTGEGGTGKSVAIRKAVNLLRFDRRKTVLCAPTGVAAQNIGGSTIHSAFRFNLAPKVADALDAVHPSKIIHEADTVIIDEIGMVRRDVMDAIARVVELENKARENDPERKHLQLVVVGDFSQLPPIVKDEEKRAFAAVYGQESVNTGFYAFEADGWQRMNFQVCQLTEVMRQSDPVFVQMLNRARVGDASCLPYFNQLVRGDVPNEATSIVSRNKDADNINNARLQALDGKTEHFKGEVVDEFPRGNMSAPLLLSLKKGAHVMTLANDRDAGYINGSAGTVTDLHGIAVDGTPAIMVRLDDGGEEVAIRRKTWDNKAYEVVDGANGKKHLEQVTLGTFTQYPLKLAYAITYHKSQGKTLDCVSIDPSAFAPGQLYVGLSRATSAAGIYLTKEIEKEHLIADKSVVEFYENTCGWTAPEPAKGDEKPVLPPKTEVKEESPVHEPKTEKQTKKKESSASNDAVVSNSNSEPNKKMPVSLEQVQRELHKLLGNGNRTWVRVYELIDHVARHELYKPNFKSFSAWVKAEAKREGVAESILWHRKSAGDFYKEWAADKDDAPTLADGERLSEDNLNLVRKISKVNAERGNELMGQMVKEGLSTKELRKEWRDHRRKAREEEAAASDAPATFKPKPCRASAAKLNLTCPDADTFAKAIEALRAAGIEVEES